MKCSSICFWLGAFVFESGVFCQTYVAIDVGGPVNGGPTLETFPTSINKQGEIAGYYTDTNLIHHGFVLASGTFTSFNAPGSLVDTFASSINDAGAITGYFHAALPPPGGDHGFVRDLAGNVTSFDPPGSISTIALSINTGGAITGYYNGLNLVVHGFVRELNGEITSFDAPGSISTKPFSINESGTITGYYQLANMSVHGFVREPGGMTESFDPPESTGTMVTAINNAGAITGYYTVASGRTFGFVRRPGGTFESFDVPGSLEITALPGSLGTAGSSINDKGAITGSYSDNSGSHGFVRSPEGMITSFDPPAERTGCTNPLSGPATFTMSINQEGVITGWCRTGLVNNFFAGFERLSVDVRLWKRSREDGVRSND